MGNNKLSEMEKFQGVLVLFGITTLFLVFGITLLLREIHWWSYVGMGLGFIIALSSKIFKEDTKIEKQDLDAPKEAGK